MSETTSDKSQVPIEREDYKPGDISVYAKSLIGAPLSKISAEQLIRGMLQIANETKDYTDLTRERVERATGVKFDGASKDDPYSFVSSELVSPYWLYYLRYVASPDKAERKVQLRFMYDNQRYLHPPMRDICQIDIKTAEQTLLAMGYVKIYGIDSYHRKWGGYRKGKNEEIGVGLYYAPERIDGDGEEHMCIQSMYLEFLGDK